MKWTLRDPSTFPITFFDAVEKAHATAQPAYLGKAANKADARSYLDRFRHWRYCLRNHRSAVRCQQIEHTQRIRTYTRKSLVAGVDMFVEVRPLIASSILDLNPDLQNLEEIAAGMSTP